ncbi:MAG TPA: multicopper oxidase domain-containing protein [Bryobacteraceae bacterium]|nr:multicopper oxidase domain-containing protein [Bryobacteraceae bacterium]
MPFHRRGFLGRMFAGGAALQAASPAPGPAPFQTPDLGRLEPRLVDGVKEFHLTAEVVNLEIAAGRNITAWGYNGSVPGPTLEVNEGDRVRVVFRNHLPEPTAVHWHGFEMPHTQDGSVGLGMDPVLPGDTYTYEFTLNQSNTCFYHSHFPMQEMMGSIGFFVINPKTPVTPRVDRDFGLLLQEWDLRPNNDVPNSLAMEFNWLTFNGKSGPDCTPMIVRQGERVRLRLLNMGMDHHPIHLHGFQFYMTATEGGRVPEAMWYPQNTILVGVAQIREVEFTANIVGEFMLHCHLPHHMMNNMIPMVGPTSHGGNHWPKDDPAAKKVPGYPQDMWMPDDEPYMHKPENYGLRRGWSAAMGGMMTLVRVVTPETYAKIEELRKNPPPRKKPAAGHEHHGGGAE